MKHIELLKRTLVIAMWLAMIGAAVVSSGAAAEVTVGPQVIVDEAEPYESVTAGPRLRKFIDPLPIPGVMSQAAPNHYEIGAYQIQQQLHSQLPPTTVWGYGTSAATASYPASTIEALRGVPITVHWTNDLVDSYGNPLTHPLPVDQTLYWADPLGTGHSMEEYTGPVPLVTHLHGGETEPQSDGHPDAWFTPGFAIKGQGWQKEVYSYLNNQLPTTLWYHDHALGATRLNVYMGLAGFYLLRDPGNEPAKLPSGRYEIPLVIQDRMFNKDGSLLYPEMSVNPEHPYWGPEFFGDVILVNGKVWPYLKVEPKKYRFRMLNGSNARVYDLRLIDSVRRRPGPAFWQIGTDGGYLPVPVKLNDPRRIKPPRLVLAPGERADIIIDFSSVRVGARLLLENSGSAPFPDGISPDPQTTGQIMQFRVVPSNCESDEDDCNEDVFKIEAGSPLPYLGTPTVTRQLTLVELMGPGGPLAMFLDGRMWDGMPSETPMVGTTELWEVVNITADAHPIHLHLVQFQPLNREIVDPTYAADWMMANPEVPSDDIVTLPMGPYLKGFPSPPGANERGWKDTFRMNPGEVSRILVRYAPQDGSSYEFDATAEPGYVWHCHILEHEDNEMMRPLRLTAPTVQMATLENQPKSIEVANAYPNPFNPVTNISFSLPEAGRWSINIYNLLGQRVKEFSGTSPVGNVAVEWNASDAASGVYFYTVEANGIIEKRKMMLLK